MLLVRPLPINPFALARIEHSPSWFSHCYCLCIQIQYLYPTVIRDAHENPYFDEFCAISLNLNLKVTLNSENRHTFVHFNYKNTRCSNTIGWIEMNMEAYHAYNECHFRILNEIQCAFTTSWFTYKENYFVWKPLVQKTDIVIQTIYFYVWRVIINLFIQLILQRANNTLAFRSMKPRQWEQISGLFYSVG